MPLLALVISPIHSVLKNAKNVSFELMHQKWYSLDDFQPSHFLAQLTKMNSKAFGQAEIILKKIRDLLQ